MAKKKEIRLTEEHLNVLEKLNIDAASKMEPSQVFGVICAAFYAQDQKDERERIDYACSEEWDLDVAGSAIAYMIATYNIETE